MSAVLTHEYEPHGERVQTMAEQQRRQSRATEILEERFADESRFQDLMDGIDAGAINPHLHRALLRLDRACYGHQADIAAVLHALSQIQNVVRSEMRVCWTDECEALAAMEVQ